MKHTAVIGAGMAGIALARTLMQAGHRVSVFEKSHGAGGRMATRNTPYGNFDHGVQYFTIRDPQFMKAITSVPGTPEICRAWSANAVRVLDPLGRVIEAPLPLREPHFVAAPGMNSLLRHWAQPSLPAVTGLCILALTKWYWPFPMCRQTICCVSRERLQPVSTDCETCLGLR